MRAALLIGTLFAFALTKVAAAADAPKSFTAASKGLRLCARLADQANGLSFELVAQLSSLGHDTPF